VLAETLQPSSARGFPGPVFHSCDTFLKPSGYPAATSYGRYQACAAVPLQSQIWSRVPSAVPPPLETSRQRPDCGFTRRFWFRHLHSWAPVPLQFQRSIYVPLALPPPVTSMHLPRTCSVPSPLFHIQFCALVPLQIQV